VPGFVVCWFVAGDLEVVKKADQDRTLLTLGASGDLTARLLLPAIGQLLSSPVGPPCLQLVATGAEDWDRPPGWNTNRLFEPLWCADHIAAVDIVLDEPLALEGRARCYDSADALADMIHSHLLQVLALIAMDPPANWHAGELRDRRADVLRVCRAWDGNPVAASRRARYTAGRIGDRDLPGYADEPHRSRPSAGTPPRNAGASSIRF